MVEVRHVTAGYGKEEILHDVSVPFAPGTVTTVLGPNGSGKSTLLKTILGALRPTGGEILVDGMDALGMVPGELAKQIAYLPQGKQVPDITVGRLVLHGRFPYLSYPRHYRQEDHSIAREAMEWMGIWELRDKPLATLSGGLRQRVYIAMALAQKAPVILMDEPTTYLDVAQQQKLTETIRQLAREGKTVVLVLHDLIQAIRLSDQMVVLEDGCVRFRGTGDALLESGLIPQIWGVNIGKTICQGKEQYFYLQ